MFDHHGLRKSEFLNYRYFNDKPCFGIDLSQYLANLLDKINPNKQGVFLEIGAGTGVNLTKLNNRVEKIVAIDVSERSLEICANQIQCDVITGSILDDNFICSLDMRADFVLLSCVLHHLVGVTRKQSRDFSRKGIINSMKLLKQGGYLIIMEPTYQPQLINSLVFYIKRIGAFLAQGRRINIFGYHNNLGAPVVSYFSRDNLSLLMEEVGMEIYEEYEWVGNLSRLQKIGGLKKFSLTYLVYKKKLP